MKTTRTFASVCLTASCIALVVAANVSVGDQPGVFRMTSASQDENPGVDQNGVFPPPTPNGNAASDGEAAGQVDLNGADDVGQVNLNGGNNTQFADPGQFVMQSAGVTAPLFGGEVFQQQSLFGPQITFDQTIDDSLGMQDSFTRFNGFLPINFDDGNKIIAGSISASLTPDGNDLYNYGVIARHYDEGRNRIVGLNFFGDYDSTGQLGDNYTRVGFGYENLGQYIDFIINGYANTGSDGVLSSRTALSGLTLAGHNVVRSFRETRENVYEGLDWKVGTPIPWLGRRGFKFFGGSYYLNSKYGAEEALGLSLQFQVQATESLEVNAFYTNDEVFGTNSWVNIAYSIPHTRRHRVLRPKTVRERLSDPVRRTNTIHRNLETAIVTSPVINTKTGLPWFINYVDPNATVAGPGTVEAPYMTLEMAKAANSSTVDAIRITPRDDGTGTNLTVAGGLDLLPEQALFSSHKDFTLFTDAGSAFVIPASSTSTAGPLVSNPTMMAGGSVIRVADWTRVSGLQIDAANAAGTVFGRGIDAPVPFDSVHLVCNTFLNYTVGANLPGASGELLLDENNFDGLAGISTHGLMLTTTTGSTSELRLSANTATTNSSAGLYVRAASGSTVDADDPLGIAGTATGIVDNVTTENGDGVSLHADAGATFNAVVERNTSTDNTVNGLLARADGIGALFNMASMRDNTFSMNTENGVFLNYRDGGSFRSVTEDLNGDGVLDPGEDVNGNGLLDQGIATNMFSHNGIAGLCILGEGDPTIDDSGTGGSGIFDIGGPQAELGNEFVANLGAGIAVDLFDSATYQADTLNNLISSDQALAGTGMDLTFVLDFWEASQGTLTDPFGNEIVPFDVEGFGFTAADFGMVTDAVLGQVRDHYYEIPTVGVDSRSSIPDGQQLMVDFVVGDIGTAPSNGAAEFYYVVVGGSPTPGTPLGVAFLSAARNAGGTGPNGFTNGDLISSIYSDNINGLGGLTPADIGTDEYFDLGVAGDNVALTDALTSGNLTFTRNALGGTISHEVGHALSLLHLNLAGAVTPTGAPPIMGTGAIDTPNQARIGLREFAYSGQNAEAGNATQMHVQQLVGALGTRSAFASGSSGAGIVVVGNDSAVVDPSTWLNNTITDNGGDALSIQMNDSARAEGVTIQTNTLQNNSGRGVNLQADDMGFIEASNTIGGSGMNSVGGTLFAQGNTITGNQSDGIRAFATNGGMIYGNAIDNTITQNAANGIALVIEGGGIIDFGTAASNRIISGNTITGNGGAGILANSTVNATVSNADQEMDVLVQGNIISQNVSGGFVGEANGGNNTPPGPPMAGFDMNNVLNLTIGQTTMPFSTPVAAESNVFDQNGEVGIGVEVNGNGFANVSIVGNEVTNTTTGTNALFNGDGINLIRRDSSKLDATVAFVTGTGNASNGLEVDAQGTNRTNINQPMSGTINSVTWNNNIFDNNGEHGAAFRTRGDSQLIADGSNNFLRNNSVNGIDIETYETSSFGDPSVVVPGALGRRVVFDGNTVTDNGVDGLWATADEGSYLLLEVTSTRIPTTSGAHAALNTNGDSNYSRNGFDGIHIDAFGGLGDGFGGSTVDVKITADTGNTFIQDNGTSGFAFGGVFVSAAGSATGEVNVMNSVITGTAAGASEDTNGNGVLDAGEDLNGNEDIDVTGGEGIAYNSTDDSTVALTVGGAAGMGNVIQGNEDDGIAITMTNTNEQGFPFPTAPVITISNNLIGGESDGVAAGNGGDGISIASFGRTEDGNPEPDSTGRLDYTGLGDDRGGAGELNFQFTQGPTPTVTVAENVISRNNRNGVNIRLNGANGFTNLRPNPLGSSPTQPNLALISRITLSDNVIISNGEDGVTMRADTDMNQNRNVFLEPIIIPPVPPAMDPTLEDNMDFSTGNVFANNLADPLGYDPDELFPGTYLNLQTVQNTLLTVTGNTIQNNGTNTVVGRGLELLVGTGAYVAADVQGNTFGGNLEQDLFTNSFLSTEEAVFASIDNAAGTVDDVEYDVVFLEDAALLDMRFTANTGDQILLTSIIDGAEYPNTDPLKSPPFGDVDRHFAEVFKIDGFGTGDLATNTFVELGVPQPVPAQFGAFRILNFSTEFPWPEDPFVDAD